MMTDETIRTNSIEDVCMIYVICGVNETDNPELTCY
jgi:hypothetical protein